jgi:hypothetical protein
MSNVLYTDGIFDYIIIIIIIMIIINIVIIIIILLAMFTTLVSLGAHVGWDYVINFNLCVHS